MSQILKDNKYELKYGNDLLKEITIQNVIGQTNCIVYEVVHNKSQVVMALKEIILQSEEEEQYIKSEQEMLKFVSVEQKNEYFIKVTLNEYNEHIVAYILMEKATISLSQFVEQRMKNNILFSPEEIIYITEECVNAFSCLQEYKIAHSDIKPENILLILTPQTQKNEGTLDHISDKYFQEDMFIQTELNKKNQSILNKDFSNSIQALQLQQSNNIQQKQQQNSNLQQQNQLLQNQQQITLQQKNSSQMIDQNDQQQQKIINLKTVLNNYTSKIKICDIGSAIRHSAGSEGNTIQINQIEGTIPFLAPELFNKYIKKNNKAVYNPYKSDVFSFGLCILFLTIQQRFYKQNRICMEESAYEEIINEWINFAKLMINQNTLISKVLEMTLQIQFDKRPDFLNLQQFIAEKMPEELERRKKVREEMNINSFQNLDFAELESFSPIKFKTDRNKNRSPKKNQSSGQYNSNIYGSKTQQEIIKQSSNNFKRQNIGRNISEYTDNDSRKKQINSERPSLIPNTIKQQPMKETDMSISLFEKTGEIQKTQGKVNFATNRGKSATRAKNLTNNIQKSDKPFKYNNSGIHQKLLQKSQTTQQTNESTNSINQKEGLQINFLSENSKPNLLEFKRMPNNQYYENKTQQVSENVKQNNSIKLPQIKQQTQQVNLQNLFPSITQQQQSDNNALMIRKNNIQQDNKIQQRIIQTPKENMNKQVNNKISNQKDIIKDMSQQSNSMRQTAYNILRVEINKDPIKKINNTGLNSFDKTIQNIGIEKLKQQLIQKQQSISQPIQIKGKSAPELPLKISSNQQISINQTTNIENKSRESEQLIVISTLEQMKKEAEEFIQLEQIVKSKKHMRIILLDFSGAFEMMVLLKQFEGIKNISIVCLFSLEQQKNELDSPLNLIDKQSSVDSTANNNNRGSQSNTNSNDNNSVSTAQSNNKINFNKVQQLDKNNQLQQKPDQFKKSDKGYFQIRAQSKSSRESINILKKTNSNKAKCSSNENLDLSFCSSTGTQKGVESSLSDVAEQQQQFKPSDVFVKMIEALGSLKQLDTLSIEFQNFIEQNQEPNFIENLTQVIKENPFNLQELNIEVTHLDKQINLLFDYIKTILFNSQSTLKSLSINLKGQLSNQELKNRTVPLKSFINSLKYMNALNQLQMNLSKNKIKKEFVTEIFEITKSIENLQEMKIDFGYNQISFPAFQLLQINPKFTNLDLNFENNVLQEGIPSLAKQLQNCKELKQLKLNFRQNRGTSNNHIIFLLSCLKNNQQLAKFNLDISDNQELDDKLFWSLQHLEDLSSWICSSLQFNIKNMQIGMTSLIHICEYLKNHVLSFQSISFTILRRYSSEQIKSLFQKYNLLEHYNFHIMKISQSHLQFTLSQKHFNDTQNKSSQLYKNIPDVLCGFYQMGSSQKKMYRCITCENSSQLKDYIQYDASLWKFCKQCIYICHKDHEFIEQIDCSDEKTQCMCSFTQNSNCQLQNAQYNCTSHLGSNLLQQSFKCFDCSQGNQDVYICNSCKDCCHKEHYTQYQFLKKFDCQCSKSH